MQCLVFAAGGTRPPARSEGALYDIMYWGDRLYGQEFKRLTFLAVVMVTRQ